MTRWRRLSEWNNAGVWQRLHEVLLAQLRAAGKPNRSRVVVDSSHVRALKGARNPPESIAGVQASPVTDAGGVPLAVVLIGGNRDDVTQPLPLLQAIRGEWGRLRRRASKVYADRDNDPDPCRGSHDCERRCADGLQRRENVGQPAHGLASAATTDAVTARICVNHHTRRPLTTPTQLRPYLNGIA